jgi:hypothetical protein
MVQSLDLQIPWLKTSQCNNKVGPVKEQALMARRVAIAEAIGFEPAAAQAVAPSPQQHLMALGFTKLAESVWRVYCTVKGENVVTPFDELPLHEQAAWEAVARHMAELSEHDGEEQGEPDLAEYQSRYPPGWVPLRMR